MKGKTKNNGASVRGRSLQWMSVAPRLSRRKIRGLFRGFPRKTKFFSEFELSIHHVEAGGRIRQSNFPQNRECLLRALESELIALLTTGSCEVQLEVWLYGEPRYEG